MSPEQHYSWSKTALIFSVYLYCSHIHRSLTQTSLKTSAMLVTSVREEHAVCYKRQHTTFKSSCAMICCTAIMLSTHNCRFTNSQRENANLRLAEIELHSWTMSLGKTVCSAGVLSSHGSSGLSGNRLELFGASLTTRLALPVPTF